ncbi:hypothetical protein GQ55_4G125100 [Panicum hallii var. hallii]|uniref:Uncharacterized protein n=1 Tax=Panicum hallii var. hallii TaxID=1504633 RepID=A0A2T7DXX2_9POAL|nr:hypothetical protein GQ55_4G125100 [Panicum hallii var. hallii]
MDDMEEYTVNDDLRACGMLGGDDDDLVAGVEALFGSSIALIIVNAGATAGAGDGGVGAFATPIGMATPTSMPTSNTGNTGQLKRVRSAAWNDFDEVLETLPKGNKVAA